jgi:hypothetical protein
MFSAQLSPKSFVLNNEMRNVYRDEYVDCPDLIITCIHVAKYHAIPFKFEQLLFVKLNLSFIYL